MNLSICTTIKNRSRVQTQYGDIFLFPNCVESIYKALRLSDNVEFIITDWESNDWPIDSWIEDKLPNIPVTLINIKHKKQEFSIGKGRNIAASYASNDMLLFLDADMLIKTTESLTQAYDIALKHDNCYPQILYQQSYNHEHWDVHQGGGNLFIKKDLFNLAGKWPEYWSYGFEDIDFAAQIKNIKPIYTSDKPIFHQWHPQQLEWKNKYASEDKLAEVQQRKGYYQNQGDSEIEKLAQGLNVLINHNPLTTHGKQRIAKGKTK